ncbi:MAG: oligopeptide ABC transporter substrate-binding protein, partial [Psychrobacillus psychrodurans]
MNKKLLALMALLLTLMLVLAACNSDDESAKPADEPDKTEEGTGEKDTEEGAEEEAEQPASDDLFPVVLDNEGEAIEGGTLQVALVNDSPFQGIFAYTLYEDAYDDEIMRFASNSLFDTDGDFLLTDTGIASL